MTLRDGACPGPPHGHGARMVKIAATSPAMTQSAATSFAPVTSCRFWMVRLGSRNNPPPSEVLIRPGVPTTVGKGRFGKTQKAYLARLFGDFPRFKARRLHPMLVFGARGTWLARGTLKLLKPALPLGSTAKRSFCGHVGPFSARIQDQPGNRPVSKRDTLAR